MFQDLSAHLYIVVRFRSGQTIKPFLKLWVFPESHWPQQLWEGTTFDSQSSQSPPGLHSPHSLPQSTQSPTVLPESTQFPQSSTVLTFHSSVCQDCGAFQLYSEVRISKFLARSFNCGLVLRMPTWAPCGWPHAGPTAVLPFGATMRIYCGQPLKSKYKCCMESEVCNK